MISVNIFFSLYVFLWWKWWSQRIFQKKKLELSKGEPVYKLRPAVRPLLGLVRDSSSCRVPVGGGHFRPGGCQVNMDGSLCATLWSTTRVYINININIELSVKINVKKHVGSVLWGKKGVFENYFVLGWLRQRARARKMRSIISLIFLFCNEQSLKWHLALHKT